MFYLRMKKKEKNHHAQCGGEETYFFRERKFKNNFYTCVFVSLNDLLLFFCCENVLSTFVVSALRGCKKIL